MGSLVCAVASYLHAKRHDGTWLVRIEDLDPPREQTGADLLILASLKAHGLHWDGEVRYQSKRLNAYKQAQARLNDHGLIYPCSCTRKRAAALNGPYDRLCLTNPPSKKADCALRFNLGQAIDEGLLPDYLTMQDALMGPSTCSLNDTIGDFIIRRKDGLFSYHLAVVVDDIDQGITHIVRGDDLLDSTPPQLAVYTGLNAKPPVFGHIPVVRDAEGVKLSKQTAATPLDDALAKTNLKKAFSYLGVKVEDRAANNPATMLMAALNT